jgi:CCR4-NOT transcriptional complex subunit CAF120
MVQTFHPPIMEVAQDTLPELQPIFTYLNSHSNKLYQDGWLLKLHDLDSRECAASAGACGNTDRFTGGRPSPNRNWQECFAQLVGTVLSIWDAVQLDNPPAGKEGEVMPTFINLADASIKMVIICRLLQHRVSD